MKKNLNKATMLAALAGAALVCLPAVASAVVSGQCSNCHTMHASQGGTTTTPQGVLLTGGCTGCHGGGTAATLTDGITGAPLVISSQARTMSDAAGTGMLPGGFFLTAAGGGTERKMHSVTNAGLAAQTVFATPPGYNAADHASNPATWDPKPAVDGFNCAGTYGCHGNRGQTDPGMAVRGKHHDATAMGFRMLNGIGGKRSTSYTITKNIYAADHNNAGGVGGSTWTLSYLCSQCHGVFHGNGAGGDTMNAGNAWIRHPSDFKLNAATGTGDAYATYTAAALHAEVPVGFDKVGAVANNTPTSGDDSTWSANSATNAPMVMCTSCHYAHGGSFDSILRWQYSTMVAGNGGGATGTGCFRCHTNKD